MCFREKKKPTAQFISTEAVVIFDKYHAENSFARQISLPVATILFLDNKKDAVSEHTLCIISYCFQINICIFSILSPWQQLIKTHALFSLSFPARWGIWLGGVVDGQTGVQW